MSYIQKEPTLNESVLFYLVFCHQPFGYYFFINNIN